MAITADRFNDLKARVKAECQRRSKAGEASGSTSVSSYAGTNYDYSSEAKQGNLIKAEHRDKNATPLNAINSSVITNASGQTAISDGDLTTLEAFTTTLETRSITDHEGTDCKGGCTGMCYGCTGTCYNACTGCTGSCTGGCKGTCTGSCTGGCTGCTSCSGCSGCGDACSSGCGTACGQGCAATCNGCSNCSGSCSGCSGTCSGGCSGYCSTACANNCAPACAIGAQWV